MKTRVEVFKTNIPGHNAARSLAAELATYYPHLSVSFDLEDCDKILRLKGEAIHAAEIISFVSRRGFTCEVLE